MDKRWENVFGFIEEFNTFESVIHFHLEIGLKDDVCYINRTISKQELQHYPEFYKMILDKLVKSLDDYLDTIKE